MQVLDRVSFRMAHKRLALSLGLKICMYISSPHQDKHGRENACSLLYARDPLLPRYLGILVVYFLFSSFFWGGGFFLFLSTLET